MDYERIDMLRQRRKIQKMVFYKLIGMTEAGYKNMRLSNSIKVSTLEKIAEVLEVSVFELLEQKSLQAAIDPADELTAPPPLMRDDAGDIMELDITDSERIEMLLEKISLLTLQLKISEKLSEVRKENIDKLKVQLTALIP